MNELYQISPITIESIGLLTKVLQFLRKFMHISTRDLEEKMGKNSFSKSMIAAVEKGERKPSETFIQKYAEALQEETDLKVNILEIAKKCIDDEDLLNKMDRYVKDDVSFADISAIVSKINKIQNIRQNVNL